MNIRRVFKVSLRTLLLLFLGVAIWMGWLIPRVQKQKRTVDWIHSVGGVVYYNHHYDANGKMIVPPAAPELPAPKTWVDYLGIDFFSSVVSVQLDREPIDDLSLLSNLSKLSSFQFTSGGTSDLSPLQNARKLKKLTVVGNEIDDISILSSFAGLERVALSDTKVHDLEPLQHLIHLKSLWLDKTSVSNLNAVSELVNLEMLLLNETEIRDLSPLKNLKSLVSLDIRRTMVNDAIVSELQESLPNCTIIR